MRGRDHLPPSLVCEGMTHMAEQMRFHVYRKNITVGLLMDMEDLAARLNQKDDLGQSVNGVSMREMHDILVPFVVSGNGRQLPADEASKHVRKLTVEQMMETFNSIFEQLAALNGADVPPTSDGS